MKGEKTRNRHPHFLVLAHPCVGRKKVKYLIDHPRGRFSVQCEIITTAMLRRYCPRETNKFNGNCLHKFLITLNLVTVATRSEHVIFEMIETKIETTMTPSWDATLTFKLSHEKHMERMDANLPCLL